MLMVHVSIVFVSLLVASVAGLEEFHREGSCAVEGEDAGLLQVHSEAVPPWQAATHRCYTLLSRAPAEMRPYLGRVCMGKQVFLRNCDFFEGTYIITEPGIYTLVEDIVFAPHTKKMLPPKDSMKYTYHGGYFLGFFAAVAVAADDVIIDLAGHCIKSSPEFVMRQRFFSSIELASSPFLPKTGPPYFSQLVEPIISANNVIVTDGSLGLSSHMAIHGNNNLNIWVNKVDMFDFETGGFQLNNGSNIHITHVEIGPSLGAHGSSGKVPSLATLSQAVSLLRHVEGTVWEHEGEFKNLDAAVEQFIYDRLHDREVDPVPFADPAWGYNGLPDGSALYGVSVTPAGPAVGEFGYCAESVENGWINNEAIVMLEDVKIHSLFLKTDEVVQLQDSQGKAIVGPEGDVMQLVRCKDASGKYKGNVLSEAQAALGQLALDHAKLAQINPTQYFMYFGASNVPAPIQSWRKGDISWDQMVKEVDGTFICGKDSMSHTNKGIVALRFECIYGMALKDVKVTDLFQEGERNKDAADKCTTFEGPYDARGMFLSALPTGYKGCKDVQIKHITAVHGTAYGLEARIGQVTLNGHHVKGVTVSGLRGADEGSAVYVLYRS